MDFLSNYFFSKIADSFFLLIHLAVSCNKLIVKNKYLYQNNQVWGEIVRRKNAFFRSNFSKKSA